MKDVELLPIANHSSPSGRVNVFIHGYRALNSAKQIEAAKERIAACGVTGDSYLLNWSAGRWRESATFAGVRAAYRVAQFRKVISPWMILVDAGVVSIAEVAQFKLMERRAEGVGRHLPAMIAKVAKGRAVNLIGHSLGARVIHFALSGGVSEVAIDDCVLLGGAADLLAADWPDCVAKIRGQLFNAYSPRDRILKITPDLRRRVGGRPMEPVVIDGVQKVVNYHCNRAGHVEYWTRIAEWLPRVWPRMQN